MLLMPRIRENKRRLVLRLMSLQRSFRSMIQCHLLILNWRKRKRRERLLVKRFEIAENEVAIAEMNNKIKFLENDRKKSIAVPEINTKDKSHNGNQNIAKVSTFFISSSSQKVDLNQSTTNASTNNNLNNSGKNFRNTSRMDLQRRPI